MGLLDVDGVGVFGGLFSFVVVEVADLEFITSLLL
jgi:hypothetical protein